jgi:NADH-ubiquinone oxidoreductase chain 6
MEFLLPIYIIKTLLPILAVVAGIFVISTKNAIISVFNLIVLYILVAFYLIFIGITYLGISYIVVYIGAIAILFLFVIMMIDIEVIDKRNNNYLPLLFLLLSGFLFTLKNNLYNLGLIKMKSLSFKEKDFYFNENGNGGLFNMKNNWVKEIEFDFLKDDMNIYNNLINGEEVNKYIIKDNFYINDSIENKQEYIFDFNNYKLLNNILFNDSIKPEYVMSDVSRFNLSLNQNLVRYNILNPDLWEYNTIYTYTIGEKDNNYLVVWTEWESAINKITQVSAIGDVLYTLYHSYIYILSVILLLGMIGAIILTADTYHDVKVINVNRMNGLYINCVYIYYNYILIFIYRLIINISMYLNNCYLIIKNIWFNQLRNYIYMNKSTKRQLSIIPFLDIMSNSNWHTEEILGSLIYFIVTTLIVAMLLLFINSYFSLNIKYLEKGGGFECGFTSFLQTRERFNIIFYRVSLLFLVFDLEIILIYPYPALYQKNQNMSKNNVLIFIYILVIGFIYELKEGALNIVKKGRETEINTK